MEGYRQILFYQKDDPYWEFSNWYPCKFEFAGQKYKSAEQYMMYQKALIMRDKDAADKIMATNSPAEAKKIASQIISLPLGHISGDVTDTVETIVIWNTYKYSVVKHGVRAKILQNKDILNKLLDTGNSFIGECSKKDKIWGIGLNIDEAKDIVIAQGFFKGDNYLGKILMELRQEFRTMISKGMKLEYVDYSNKLDDIDIFNSFPYELYFNPIYRDAMGACLDVLTYNEKCGFLHHKSFERFDAVQFERLGFKEMIQKLHEIYYLCN